MICHRRKYHDTKHNFHNLLVHFRTLMINNWMGNLYQSDATSVVIIVVISVKYLTPIINKNKHFHWINVIIGSNIGLLLISSVYQW